MSTILRSSIRYQTDQSYDINIVLLIHFSGAHRDRLESFKKFGLLNASARKVHLALLGSRGDGNFLEEITAGWPSNFDVSFIEFDSNHPIPKINAYYLWQMDSQLKARWHLRLDDDSITDVEGMLRYADDRFGDMPVHLMTSPHWNEDQVKQFSPFLAEEGLHPITLVHEHESSLTSRSAFEIAFAASFVRRLLRKTMKDLKEPGDQVLALIMHCVGIPVVDNPKSSVSFLRDRLSITGGHLFHIHYVHWKDEVFVKMLSAFLLGERRAVGIQDVEHLIGVRLLFGRCIATQLATIQLLPEGQIQGSTHANESTWTYQHGSLMFLHSNGTITTVFNVLLKEDHGVWLIGPHLTDSTMHYLCKEDY